MSDRDPMGGSDQVDDVNPLPLEVRAMLLDAYRSSGIVNTAAVNPKPAEPFTREMLQAAIDRLTELRRAGADIGGWRGRGA